MKNTFFYGYVSGCSLTLLLWGNEIGWVSSLSATTILLSLVLLCLSMED
jgi:hypothetical protein